MFGHRFFGARYYGARYWGDGEDPIGGTIDGASSYAIGAPYGVVRLYARAAGQWFTV